MHIAVFDSGVGGISVLKELRKQMPIEDFLYFGDSANAPYGDKSTEAVRQLCLDAAKRLITPQTKALVVACNTATSAAINILRRTDPNTIIIGIEPALKVAADRFPAGKIGIMATEVTLREEKLSTLQTRFPDVQVFRISAPGLVEKIESGKAESAETSALLEEILAPYGGKLDALVLGCTHYPFVKDAIGRILPGTALLDGGEGTARHTKQCLENSGLLGGGTGKIVFQNSLNSPEILSLCEKLLEE